MSQTKLVVSCLSLLLLASCGGGGGGGNAAGGGPSGGGGPVRQQADLTGTNASAFAEVFRNFVGAEIEALDEVVSGIGGDVPVLSLTNTNRTDPCDTSGTSTFTIAGNGADVTLQYDSCVEQGVTTTGRIALSFTNVNASARSYDYRVTYTALEFKAGSLSQKLNGTTTIHTETIGGTHVHQVTVDHTRDQTQPTATFTADVLVATVRHQPGDYYGLEVTAASGAIGVSGRGFATVAYRPATSEIQFSGGQGSEAFVRLDGKDYGIRYKDAQGRDREVVIAAMNSGELSVLDGENSSPTIGFFPDLSINAGDRRTLDLHDGIFDPDFEPVEVTVAITAATPQGHLLPLTKLAADRYEIAAGDGGMFTVTITATDSAGARALKTFIVTVYGDSDHDGLLDSSDPDDDNDGVPDDSDASPFDPTEWRDSDHDGSGDNADPDDDNDGVDDAHDAFPLDPACSSASGGSGTQCFFSTLRGFDTLLVESGVLYFVKMSEKRVYRWDSDADAFLTPWQLGTAVPSASMMTSAAYVPSHDRFYFGYSNGAITAVGRLLGTEQAFASVPLSVRGLANAGNFVMAQDTSGAWATHYVFASNGALRSSAEWNYYSRAYAFNPAERRVYFFRDDQSPDDLHYEEIDQTTGLRVSAGETPYHGAYGIEPPIVVAPTGNLILIGSGNLFNAGSLTWAGAVPGGIKAAAWDAADGLIQLRGPATGTVLDRRDAALHTVEQRAFEGAPRALVRVLHGYVVVTETAQRIVLSRYQPSDDTDGDGISNTVDAFPLDVAASIDTDNDGYPDSWNGGRSQADSTTGLVLDAYPTESACYLPQHGNGTTCDVASTLPDYEPDAIVGDADGIAYLLSADNNRIYRYSGLAAKHLSPIVVGNDAPLNRSAPSRMEYSPQHQRLYLGYESGAVTYVDLHDPQLRERAFANVATAVGGLGAAGEYLAVQDFSGAWATHYYFDQSGTLRDSIDWNYFSRDYEWNATLRRLFFFRDDTSPNDLHFEEIAPDGTIHSNGETPYHGTYSFNPPIVMSPDDQYVLIGSGNIFRSSDLTWYRSLLGNFTAAVWDGNGKITTAAPVGGATRIYRYDANQVWQSEETRAGEPIALLEHANGYLLVTSNGTKPVFSQVSR